ncbi:hypothetical protein JCM13304A_04450 [Desulfothermus okinawensis JCM 13304]
MKVMEKNNNQLVDEREKLDYIYQVEKLIKNMLDLSNKGINKFNNEDLLILCGLIRDCAFRIKKKLKD